MALGVSSGLLQHSASFSGSLEIGGPVHGTWHSRVPGTPSTERGSAYLSSFVDDAELGSRRKAIIGVT